MSRSYVRVQQVGDWVRCRDTLRWYDRESKDDIQDAIFEVMDEAKDDLKEQIESGGLPLAPLSASWAEYKDKHGLDPRILIATGEYLDSFEVTRIGDRTWQLMPKGFEELAGWLEYGTPEMPARPHWIYITEELPGRLKSEVQHLFRTKGGAS